MIKNVAIFASGEGTNAQNMMNYFKTSNIIKIALVVSNNPSAPVLVRAKKSAIPTLVINRHDFYENNTIIEKLKTAHIDWIILAGFLWKIPENLITAFPTKIINIHPALLPKFGGKGMYGMNVHEAVINAKEKQSGISIHFVNEQYDEGEIIAQHKCVVSEIDTPVSLAEKIHALEKLFFPSAIEKIISKHS